MLAGARYVEELFNAIRGFAIAIILGPESYGLWHIIKIAYMFGEQAGLGTTHAMVREAAYHNSSSLADKALVRRYQQTALSFGAVFSIFIAILGLIVYFQFFDTKNPVETILTAIAFLFSFSYLFVRSKLQSENQMVQIVKVSLGFVILNFIIGLSLLVILSVQGLLLGVILSYLSALMAQHLKFIFLAVMLWFVMWLINNDEHSIMTSLHQSVLYILITMPLLILQIQKEYPHWQQIIFKRNQGEGE